MTQNKKTFLPRFVVPLTLLAVPLIDGWVLWVATSANGWGWMALGVAAAVAVSGST